MNVLVMHREVLWWSCKERVCIEAQYDTGSVHGVVNGATRIPI